MPRNAGSPLARPSEPLTRESRVTSTTRRPETSVSAAKTRPDREALLGRRPPILVRMATIPRCGHARTVVRWHKAGFRLYWKLISRVRRPVGRGQASEEVRELIFRMVVENPTWGAPRMHGELLMLSFDVSERTISRWMKRATRDPEPAKRWLTFLRNHREAVAAMDFFTVRRSPSARSIASSSSVTIVGASCTSMLQSIRQARGSSSSCEKFPFGSAPRFVIFDRDAKYGLEVPAAVRSLSVSPVLTSFESAWQNGVAERRVGSCRRDISGSGRERQMADLVP